jgi:TolB-like protein
MKKASPDIKLIISISILFMVAFCCRLDITDAEAQVKTDKDVYNAGETIRVNFSNAPGSSRDWICIVAAGSPDNDAGDYKYMPGRASQGDLSFDTPPPGKYEVRAYYNYSRNGYVVSARYSFTVADKASPPKPVASEEKIKAIESPAAKAPSASVSKVNVSVFHFTPLSIDATPYGITVTNTLINDSRMQSSFTMLGRKDLEFFLSTNNLQQNDQIDSIVEIGTRLGLNFIIAGNVVKRGTMIVTECRVIDITQRNIIFTNKFTSTGEANLINNVTKMSNSIIEAILRSSN